MSHVLLEISITTIPYATLFILGLAALISFITSFANRRLTDPGKAKAVRKEVGEWQRELREAQKKGDKKTLDKLMKKQQYIMQLQSKMMWQSMKVTLLFIVPLFIMWQVLGGYYVNNGQPITIAYFPGLGPVIPIPLLGSFVSLFWWYLLCSLLSGTIMSHLLGLVEISE